MSLWISNPQQPPRAIPFTDVMVEVRPDCLSIDSLSNANLGQNLGCSCSSRSYAKIHQ